MNPLRWLFPQRPTPPPDTYLVDLASEAQAAHARFLELLSARPTDAAATQAAWWTYRFVQARWANAIVTESYRVAR